jgi:hypothetical protein
MSKREENHDRKQAGTLNVRMSRGWLFPTLSVPACCLWMEISFSIVLERKTLKKNEVKEDGRVAVSAPV